MDIYSDKGKQEIIKQHTPRTKIGKNAVLAFLFGGAICAFGEALRRLFIFADLSEKNALTCVSLSLILLASLFTALGIFDKIARHAGAGTLVPITGFSNAITSEAIDSKSEGFVLGLGAKIFTIAGPVILFGLVSGVVYGIIYYLACILKNVCLSSHFKRK